MTYKSNLNQCNRTLILYLQVENVQVAIQKSYKTAPKVLQPEIFRLIEGLDDDPDSNIPYSEFLPYKAV